MNDPVILKRSRHWTQGIEVHAVTPDGGTTYLARFDTELEARVWVERQGRQWRDRA